MKSLMILAGTLLLCQSAQANGFNPGNYSGEGNWKSSNGESGTYDVAASIATSAHGNQMTSVYTFGAQKITVTLQTSPEQNGYFDVLNQGVKIGSGYCMTVQCHYEADLGSARLEETLTFYQSHLYRVGSKTVQDKTISWQEGLK